MPFPRRGPTPPVRLVELLAEAKRRTLEASGEVTVRDFDHAWEWASETMIRERAFPHDSTERRQWKNALRATKPEMRGAFLDRQTSFGFVAARFREAAGDLGFELETDELPTVIIGAIRSGYLSIASESSTTEGAAA